MSTQVEINGINFLPIKEAAKLVSYSRDYVSRLAREQKIVATQIGRQWFIDIVSLKNFAETSVLELSVRKQQLSVERKREQIIKQEVKQVRKSTKSKIHIVRRNAQLVSVLVLGFGLLAGVGIYTTSSIISSQSFNLSRVESVAQIPAVKEMSPSGSFEGEIFEIAKPQATTLFTTVTEYPLFIDEEETRLMSIGNSEGIFLLGRNGEVREIEEVEALFSDDVSVEFIDENTGVITYVYEEGKIKEFPFISLPAKEIPDVNIVDDTL